ncbi:hypothetical protein ORD21_17800 [Deinococcus sp. ZS9-10]|uniref:Transposase IS111A/IS1328/IS1533 N-terminal domain-containing protein n=1 Tax=Deinococcus arenicola TaxID=2994950 RepID=A0ABU4DVH5_9DEIO|nr:hypothetical protein [Deinococcus sp. ZS9-10]MDV6376449.1 hypothetical protein [Deinococcus sp. ZS9-10]
MTRLAIGCAPLPLSRCGAAQHFPPIPHRGRHGFLMTRKTPTKRGNGLAVGAGYGPFAGPVCPTRNSLAMSAQSAARGHDARIFWCELMPSFAVRFFGINRYKADAAQSILLWRDWLKMGRINTGSVTANVIEMKPFRNYAAAQFKSDSVRCFQLALDIVASIAIPESASPYPARFSLIDVSPKHPGKSTFFQFLNQPRGINSLFKLDIQNFISIHTFEANMSQFFAVARKRFFFLRFPALDTCFHG